MHTELNLSTSPVFSRKVLVAIDGSGARAFDENFLDKANIIVNDLSDSKVIIKVVLFDMNVIDLDHKEIQSDIQRKTHLLRGGTAIEEVLSNAVKEKMDHVIFLTDGFLSIPEAAQFGSVKSTFILDNKEYCDQFLRFNEKQLIAINAETTVIDSHIIQINKKNLKKKIELL